MYHNYDFITSISAAITSVSVVGPGLGNIIGPEESFTQLPFVLKLLLSFGMILGRLEIFFDYRMESKFSLFSASQRPAETY